MRWLIDEIGLDDGAARQIVDYLAAAHAALGLLPTRDTLVFERFFDAVGGMHLVIHSPYGSRLNRAWGLALRKRFCARFNFELQAAATEDNISLSLTTVHSFALDEVSRYLHSASVRDVLIQALLDAPMFMTRWRWVSGVALALAALSAAGESRRRLPAWMPRIWSPRFFPIELACAKGECPRRAGDPGPSRWSARRSAIAFTEAMDLFRPWSSFALARIERLARYGLSPAS